MKGISSNLAEKALPQYSELLTTLTQDHFENAKAFAYKESRFQKSTLRIPNELKSILTLVLVISHGQAFVERGFSTNKSISKDNLSEKLMVPRKMIIDHLQKAVYSPVKCACQHYHIDLEQQKKKAKSDAINDEILNAEMKNLTQLLNLVDACKKLDNEVYPSNSKSRGEE